MMCQSLRALAFVPPDLTHFIDHLGVIASIVDIPLVFLNEQERKLADRYYPNLKTELFEYENVTPDYLFAHYDALFTSDLWKKEGAFQQRFLQLEQQSAKRFRRVYCTHGFSDKMFYWKHFAGEDICLAYGPYMLDLFNQLNITNSIGQLIVTGHYRYLYYQTHQELLDKAILAEIRQHLDLAKPTLLYAPTWKDAEGSTSFFEGVQKLIEDLPKRYNLIIKVHPLLEFHEPERYYPLVGQAERKEGVVIIKDNPLVLPFLALADLFIGDRSSVGYDFLAFDRPMIFLMPDHLERGVLNECGTSFSLAQISNLYQKIDQIFDRGGDGFSSQRQQLYHYTFGQPRSFETIKQEILQALVSTSN